MGRQTLAGRLQWMLGQMFGMVLLLLALGLPASAQPLQGLPPLSARVVDLTSTLSAGEVQALEAKLAALEAAKGSQLVVLMVPSTLPEPIEDYSIRLAQAWKIGRGQNPGAGPATRIDDGVILLVAKQDRKIRIEVGYGLEGAIPDIRAKRVITESIAPHFKRGDFAGGIDAGVDDLTKLIQGEALPEVWRAPTGARSANEIGGLGEYLVLFVFFAIFASLILGRWLGSAASGLAAGVVAGSSGLALPIAVGLGVAAAVMVFVLRPGSLARTAGARRRGGSGPVFIPSGGWGSGGWGGGSGGGGFGGGGGGFGGGGASGDW